MRGAASELAAAPVLAREIFHAPATQATPVPHNDSVELNDVCRAKSKLPYQTDSDAARHMSGAVSGSGLTYL